MLIDMKNNSIYIHRYYYIIFFYTHVAFAFQWFGRLWVGQGFWFLSILAPAIPNWLRSPCAIHFHLFVLTSTFRRCRGIKSLGD